MKGAKVMNYFDELEKLFEGKKPWEKMKIITEYGEKILMQMIYDSQDNPDNSEVRQ